MELGSHVLTAAFFAIAGISLVVKRATLLEFAPLYGARNVPQSLRTRLDAAVRRRAETDGIPTGWAGLSLGALSLAFVPLVLLTDIPFDTVLAALVFASAVALAATYAWVRLTRRRFSTRLAARTASGAVPPHVWILAATLTLMPSLWFGLAPIGASLLTCGGLAIVTIAYKIATIPFVASGVDRGVEAFVDARVRSTRVAVLCACAIAPGYFFELTTPGDFTTLMRVVLVLVPLGVIASNVRMTALVRKPNAIEVARWAHATQ